MKQYIKADWDDSKYINVGNLKLPLDARDYGNQTGEEISRQVKQDYQNEMDRQEAERKAAEEAELSRANYEKAMEALDPSASSENQLETLFDLFVPASGKSDNVAGELARAMMKILYRDYNDGDVFYEGYGLETCVDRAAFIIDTVTAPENDDELGNQISERFFGIAEDCTTDDAYTKQLNAICDTLIQYLMNHPELFGRETKDSCNYKSRTIQEIKDTVPEYEYECDLSGDLERYIENGCISWDDIYWWLQDLCSEYGGEVNQRALDWFEIDYLSPSEYETWEREFPDRIWSYLDSLEEEFPNYGESDEDEEDDYDEYDEEDDEEL